MVGMYLLALNSCIRGLSRRAIELGVLSSAAAALIAFAPVAPTLAQTSEGDQPPDRLFVLGDSLSDVGNAAALTDFLLDEQMQPEATVGLCNPGEIFLQSRDCGDLIWRRSRVSNGPVAVEHAAALLGLSELTPSFHTVPERPEVGTNYAVAGGKARATGMEDLARQVDLLLLDQGPRLPASALYLVMIGGNDAIDALQAAALPALPAPDEVIAGSGDRSAQVQETSVEIVDAAVAAIGAAVDRLIAAGAQHVMVATVPDLSLLPAVRQQAREQGTDEAAALAAASAITDGFNEKLNARLAHAAADHPAETIEPFDLRAALDTAVNEAAQAGLNVTDACFDSEAYLSGFMAERTFHEDCAPEEPGAAPRFDEFVFWDGIHPTGAVHAELGEALFAAVQALFPTS